MVLNGIVACMATVSQSGRGPVGGVVGPASALSGVKTGHRPPINFILPAQRMWT
jgi:hypothetical protein